MKRDIVWSALEALGSALCSVAAAFVIARLIGPAELGVGATAVAVHVLLGVGVTALFADAIVQRDTLDEVTLSSAVWASAGIGCGAALAQGCSGWLLAWMLDDPRLVPMAWLLALPLPFVGLAGALQGWLTRQRRYRALAARTLIGLGTGMTVGILLASGGAGAWAAVAQQAAGSLLAACVLIAVAGWRPVWVCRGPAVRSLLRIGLPLTASTLVQIGRYRVFAILIGGTAGPTALGQIHVAFRLVDTVREIAFTGLWRLLLPILSEYQHDPPALARQVDRLLRLSSMVTLPLCAGLAAGLMPMTALLLGPAWHQAGEAGEPLVALMALMALMFPSGVALVAVGRARFTLYGNLAGLTATVAFVLLFRPDTPWDAVLAWCGAQLFVSPYSLWINARALGVNPVRPLRAGVPMALISAAALATAMPIEAGGLLDTLLLRSVAVVAVTALGVLPMLRNGLRTPVRPEPPAESTRGRAADHLEPG